MRKFKTSVFTTQYQETIRVREKNSGITKTIPDQTLTVMDLVRNHTLPNMVVNEGNYHDPTGIDEESIGMESGRLLHKMDISEVHDELQEIEQRELARKEEDKRQRKEKAKKLLNEEQLKTFEKWKQEELQKNNKQDA